MKYIYIDIFGHLLQLLSVLLIITCTKMKRKRKEMLSQIKSWNLQILRNRTSVDSLTARFGWIWWRLSDFGCCLCLWGSFWSREGGYCSRRDRCWLAACLARWIHGRELLQHLRQWWVGCLVVEDRHRLLNLLAVTKKTKNFN